MLTKEHLKFKVRNGRALPVFLLDDDAHAKGLAGELVELFRGGKGQRLGELEAAAAELAEGDLGAAFRKLLLDACETEEDDGQIEEFRWRALLQAEALRRQRPTPTPEAFRQEIGAVGDRLYADLPACRKVSSFKDMNPDALIDRYNCAQVQGLLLRARSVTVRLRGAELGERRELFRQMKFHRLLGAVQPITGKRGGIEVTLSGPLTLVEQAATYGLRLATFFPRVLHLADWEIEADVHIKNRELTLKVDASAGLRSHYRSHRPYIPEELTAFIELFNAGSKWRAEVGTEFVHVGSESYCFPDLTITGQGGRAVHVELFHRWHASPLLDRLQALDRHPVSNLFLGVSKNLAKKAELETALKDSRAFAKSGFLFTEFPTPKTIGALLERC